MTKSASKRQLSNMGTDNLNTILAKTITKYHLCYIMGKYAILHRFKTTNTREKIGQDIDRTCVRNIQTFSE